MAKYMDTQYYLVVNKNDYVVATFFRQSEAERYAMNRAELGYRVEKDAEKEELIPLREWAINNGISPDTARQRARRGAMKTARRVGRDWVIDKHEQLIDGRRKQ